MATNIPSQTANVIGLVDDFDISSAEVLSIDIDITPLSGIDAVNSEIAKITDQVLRNASGAARFIRVSLAQAGTMVFSFGLGVAADWKEEDPLQAFFPMEQALLLAIMQSVKR